MQLTEKTFVWIACVTSQIVLRRLHTMLTKQEIIDAAIVTYAGYPYDDKQNFLEGLTALLVSTLGITTQAEFYTSINEMEAEENAKS
jgi:hypothetical protein